MTRKLLEPKTVRYLWIGMKVKEWVDGALVLEGDILDGAEEAFRDARYVEAFALLHAYDV